MLGGGIVRAEDHVLPVFEETVRARDLPLAVRDLDIVMSQVPEEVAGVSGAVHLALDQIFAAPQLARLLTAPSGTPAAAG